MPTNRTDRTHHIPERAMTPDEAIDQLSYRLWWLVRRRLEREALQAQQAQQGHPEATTAPEPSHD